MSSTTAAAITALVNQLVHHASADPELRSLLRQLAEVVLEATVDTGEERTESVAVPSESDVPSEEPAERLAPADAQLAETTREESVEETQPTAPLPELTLGQPKPADEPVSPRYPSHQTQPLEYDLQLIERSCRLKAEGSRWAASRRRLIAEGANFSVEVDPIDRELIAKAKELPDCFLWMNNPTTAPSPSGLRQFEILARSYEAVAEVLALIRQIGEEPNQYESEFEQCLDLLAEAQSALRVAVHEIDGPNDWDQLQVFGWLKAATSKYGIFVQRYMRANDPADPLQWESLTTRIEAVDVAIQEKQRRAKQRRKLLNKVRHKLSLIAEDPEDAEAHWEILINTVDKLIQDGLPPSNRELRELLLPAIDELPDLTAMPKNFELVLREIDRYLATSPMPESSSKILPTAAVQEVAQLLKGRSLVLIGGERRPGSQEALKEAFQLQDMIWIGTREHQPIDSFEPHVARPDVAVVLLAIRWSSHSHGDVKEFCDRHGKPLVRLPTGYNPNQVAVQILEQCSERLK